MNTSFGVINDTMYEITDWHQLINIPSDYSDIKCMVTTIDDEFCDGISITVYNIKSNIIYTSFFVVGSDSKIISLQSTILEPNTVENILATFGFHVRYINHYNITIETKNVLESCLSLGFNFIHKFDFKNNYIYVSKYNSSDSRDLHLIDIKEFPNSNLCDFSFLKFNDRLSISDILDNAVII